MSATELLSSFTHHAETSKSLTAADATRLRDEIHREFEVSTNERDRVILLGLHKAIMDAWERSLAQDQVSTDKLQEFRTLRSQDYNLLIARETVDAHGQVIPAELLRVTEREVKGGRMAADHELRKLAVDHASKRDF